MKPIDIRAWRCPRSDSLYLKLVLNDYFFDIVLPRSHTNSSDFSGEIPTLDLFRFIRENMELKTINQFKQLEEIEE